MYCRGKFVVARAHVRAIRISRRNVFSVTAPEAALRQCARTVGKTSERMIADQDQYAGEVSTKFNDFARIMTLNQADIRTDQ
jgi:hypothetical protein